MSEAVVHGLEVVQVHDHDGQLLTEAPALVQLDAQHVQDVLPVVQAGEGILDGLMVQPQPAVLEAQEPAQLLAGDLEEPLEVLGRLPLGHERQRPHGGIARGGGCEDPEDGIAQGPAALIVVGGGMPVAARGNPEGPLLRELPLQGLAVLGAGRRAVHAFAPDTVLAEVGHHEGARQHQLLQDLDEALDEPRGVVIGGVEPGDGVPQGGLQQPLLKGLGQPALDGLHAEVLLGQLGRRVVAPGAGGLLGERGCSLHHVIQIAALHQEAVGATGLGPEAGKSGSLGGQQQDGQVPGGLVIFHESAELIAVEQRHDAVAHHHIGGLRGEHDEGLGAVAGLDGGVSVPLEEMAQQAQLDGVVIHQEHLERVSLLGQGVRHRSLVSNF